ncbi:hypothetical protein EV424DRAFT_1385045 [Suillus variegatus]|nr:hypothetical protein EV424DRAFT_1385045 [Suillus variegatus]
MEALERRVVIDSLTSEKYLRVASISVAFYDYILTLPAEWRFYRSQSSIFHISLACTLFILIRYISIMAIVISNYGFFSTAYTLQTCQQYYLVAPAFKGLSYRCSPTMTLLTVLAFNIARRNRRIGIVLLLLYLLSVSAEWFSDMFHRTHAGKVLSTWFYYLAVLVYDIVIVTISTMHLLRYNPLSSRVEQLIRVLIYDGIGYLIVLSAANVLNLILYHTTNIDTQVLGYALTWIMSQRILINIREPHAQHLENVIVARPTLTAQKKVMSGLRSQFESKSHSKGSNGSKNPVDAELRAKSPRNSNDMELGIRVRVERSVMVDYMEESEESSSLVK